MRIHQLFALLVLLVGACATQAQDRRLMVLDAQYYLNKYPDLQKAFGPNNLGAAKQHWLNTGSRRAARAASFI